MTTSKADKRDGASGSVLDTGFHKTRSRMHYVIDLRVTCYARLQASNRRERERDRQRQRERVFPKPTLHKAVLVTPGHCPVVSYDFVPHNET